MCTLIIINQALADYPLIVAANRDEHLSRPSAEPDWHMSDIIGITAPIDLQSGGTWIGIARGGWFVGITNQDADEAITGTTSRGMIVKECLELSDHFRTLDYLRCLNRTDFKPFNLVFGRAGMLFLYKHRQDRVAAVEIVSPGITIVSNDCDGPTYDAKLLRTEAMTKLLISSTSPDEFESLHKGLFGILSDHGSKNGDDAVCLHDPMHVFGTKSASVIIVNKNNDASFYHKESPPCKDSQVLSFRVPAKP